MNRDEGQYHLSHVFDKLLLSGDKTSRNSRSVAKQPLATTAVVNHYQSCVEKGNSLLKRPQSKPVSGNH